MLAVTLLTAVAVFGGVWADTCEQHSRLTPLLATTAEPTPTVYAWPEEAVELHCRPSQAGGCRWLKDSTQLGTDCRLNTTERGTIKCLRGDETCGSIRVNNPSNQRIEKENRRQPDHYYEYSYRYRQQQDRYWSYNGERNWIYKPSTFLCFKSGTIIRQDKLCDGNSDCVGGEDELGCSPPCGPPFVGQHTTLATAVLDSYPDGSQVTYVCHPGFSFRETLSGLNRTCRAGRWTAPPPVCRQHVALNRTVKVTGKPMADCRTALDGDLNTWCILAPSVTRQSLSIRLAENATVTKVLVRSVSNRYDVLLRNVNQIGDELSCFCQESSNEKIHPVVSGVRICDCPEQQPDDRRELLIRTESGVFMSLSIAEVVAMETPDAEIGECTLLGHPAHGRFESAGSGIVKLSCDPGYSRSCSDAVQCFALRSGSVRLSCQAASCSQPPAIPNTKFTFKNGTNWRDMAEYSCLTGYVLYPADQNMVSSCDSGGLWSIGHISCLPETDVRVVAMRLGQQHARSMAALRSELQAGQQRLLSELNSTQHRLSKLERDVSLLGLAEGAYLPAVKAVVAEIEHMEETDTEPSTEGPEEGSASGSE